MRSTSRLLVLVSFGVLLRAPAPEAAVGHDITIVDGQVSGAAHDAPLAEVVEEIVGRAGGSVRWLQKRPERRTAAAFKAEPVAEAVGRLLPGGSMMFVLGAAGRIRQLVVLQAAPDDQPDPPAKAPPHTGAPKEPPVVMATGRAEPVGQPGPDPDVAALVEAVRDSGDEWLTAIAVDSLARIGLPSPIVEAEAVAQGDVGVP